MPLYLKMEQRENLNILRERSTDDAIELCKSAFEYLTSGPNPQKYEEIAKKYSSNSAVIRQAVEALISLLIDATKANAGEEEMQRVCREAGYSEDVLDVLAQFVVSKRNFIEGSIKSANIRAYRLVNLEWRLEVRVASRSLLRQSNVLVTMKLYLHTEPKNENRDLLETGDGAQQQQVIHADERRNRRDLVVQTDLSSLTHMIHVLEEALSESRSRRIRNIVEAIH